MPLDRFEVAFAGQLIMVAQSKAVLDFLSHLPRSYIQKWFSLTGVKGAHSKNSLPSSYGLSATRITFPINLK